MRKKITNVVMLTAALSFTSLCINAQDWTLTGNPGATNANFFGPTAAGINLRIFTGGVAAANQRMTILGSNGNVGIGVAAPTTKLHVVGTSRLQGSTTIVGVTTVTGNASISGNLGLGITAPTQKLHVVGNALITGTTSVTGNLGLGIAAPTEKLHVVGNALISGTVGVTGDLFVPGNLRNDNTTGAQIVKVSTTGGSDCGIQFNRPGIGFFDFRMVNIGGNLRWQGSSDEFATVTNEFMNLNLQNGSLGIGVAPGLAKLSVCGTVRCTELRVETGWCDYVFAKDYKLRPLEEVAAFIEENHHLPEIEPASVIENEGLKVGEMSAKMIKKIEELTLYVIQQNERLKVLEMQNEQLKNSRK